MKDFIIALNKFDGVDTSSSCSGHNTRAFICFKYNESENLRKVLNFFKKEDFKVELQVDCYPIDFPKITPRFGIHRSYEVLVDLISQKLTSEGIERFWKIMEERLFEFMKER